MRSCNVMYRPSVAERRSIEEWRASPVEHAERRLITMPARQSALKRLVVDRNRARFA
jgi:hypothetical protein